MEDEYEESFKRALFDKVRKVNPLVNNITIGPNSLRNLNLDKSPYVSPEERLPQSKIQKKEQSSSLIDTVIPTNQFLKLLDLQRQEKAQTALNERLSLFREFSKTQEELSKQSWLQTQQTFIQDMEKQEMYIIEASQQYDLQQSSQRATMAQLTQNAIQRTKQRQEILKEKERQRQILAEYINKIKMNQKKFTIEYYQVYGILKSCTDNKELMNCKELQLTLHLPAEIEAILSKCKEDISSLTEKDVQKSEEIVTKITDFKHKFKTIVDDINKKQQIIKAESNTQEQASINAPQPGEYQGAAVPTPVINNPIVIKTDTKELQKQNFSDNLNKLSKYVNIKDLQTYTELMSFNEEYKRSFSQLENDQSLKLYKFDCKKAINIPVNSLSGVNSEHIMDKYRKLHKLLTGQTVFVGDKEINATRHPQGIPFCMDLLAKKFVLQGDLMVSSNPESAFCYASMIVSLWNDFPDFGKILLAYFYKMCPYLIPYYIPKRVGESDEEFYMKLGYQYSDGEVEKQDKFLKRMSGIMKLYFAIMIAKPKKDQNSHPYNLKHGWKWLAAFLRLEPQLDVTATALHVFLETVGFEMRTRYGLMFQKLLTVIIQVFLPKCKEVKCTGGAVTRLDLLLTNYVKTGKFDKPNGYMEYSYW